MPEPTTRWTITFSRMYLPCRTDATQQRVPDAALHESDDPLLPVTQTCTSRSWPRYAHDVINAVVSRYTVHVAGGQPRVVGGERLVLVRAITRAQIPSHPHRTHRRGLAIVTDREGAIFACRKGVKTQVLAHSA